MFWARNYWLSIFLLAISIIAILQLENVSPNVCSVYLNTRQMLHSRKSNVPNVHYYWKDGVTIVLAQCTQLFVKLHSIIDRPFSTSMLVSIVYCNILHGHHNKVVNNSWFTYIFHAIFLNLFSWFVVLSRWQWVAAVVVLKHIFGNFSFGARDNS